LPLAAKVPAAAAPTILGRIPWFTLALCAGLTIRFQAELKTATDFIAPGEPGHFSLLALGASSRVQAIDHGEWWRLFTAPALHGSYEHIIGNLVSLLLVGFLLEPLIGIGWFAAIYFVGSLSGVLFSMLLNDPTIPSVGASGAIMACMAGLYVLSYHDGVKRPALMRRMSGFVLFPALTPSAGGNIDLNAHLGGVLGGLLVAFLLLICWPEKEERMPGRSLSALLAAGLLGLTAWAFVTSEKSFAGYAEPGRDVIQPADLPRTAKDMMDRSYELVQKYPKDPRANMFRGFYFLQKSNLADAEPYLREALRLGENSPVMSRFFINWTSAMLALDLDLRGRRPEALPFARPACGGLEQDDRWLMALKERQLCP
jgi:membrane associated rhomboid family serine protease